MTRSTSAALATLVALSACTHDWEAYDVEEVEAIELTATQLESCQKYCRAHDICDTPIDDCDHACAQRIVDCSDDGAAGASDDVGDCAEAYQPITGCSEQILTACLLSDAPCF